MQVAYEVRLFLLGLELTVEGGATDRGAEGRVLVWDADSVFLEMLLSPV